MSDKRECLICKGDNTKFFEVGIKGCQGKVFTTYCYDCDEISLGITPDFQIDRETGISRNKKGKLYDKSKGDPYPCRSCFYEDNSKDDNTCGTCHTYSNNGELFRTWRPKEKWEAKLK